MAADDWGSLPNKSLRAVIASNVRQIQRTRDDSSLTHSKMQLIVDRLQKQIDRAQEVLAERRNNGTYRKYEERNGSDDVLLISAAIYASIVVGAIALAPFTGGKSLIAIAAVLVAVFVHGMLYVLFS